MYVPHLFPYADSANGNKVIEIYFTVYRDLKLKMRMRSITFSAYHPAWKEFIVNQVAFAVVSVQKHAYVVVSLVCHAG